MSGTQSIPTFMDMRKSASIVAAQNSVADVTPEELSSLFGGQHEDDDSDPDDEEDATPSTSQFILRTLKALAPTPYNLADVLSSKTVMH